MRSPAPGRGFVVRRGQLSPAQQGLWLLEQSGAAAVYHNVMAVECRGPLERSALEHAMQAVAARHESLRTRFTAETGQPVQEVLSEASVPFEDLTACGTTEDAVAAARAWAGRPFRFGPASPPPIRAALTPVGSASHLLVIVAHHLISDGDSMMIVLGELLAAYAARVLGNPDPLGAVPAQFLDVVDRPGPPGVDIAFWCELLDGAPDVLDLPLDRPRPRRPSYRGGSWQHVFAPDTIDAVRELARSCRVSVFMVILASLAVLLTRLANTEEAVVGVPMSLRRDLASRGTTGYLVNTIALRIPVAADVTGTDLLTAVRRLTSRGYDHSQVPFSSVVKELRRPRRQDHHPVFQVLFAFTDRGNAAAERYARPVAGLTLTFPVVEPARARTDVSFCVHEVDGTLAVDVEYATDMCDEATAAALATALESLLAASARSPALPVRTLSLTAPRAWPGRAAGRPAARTAGDVDAGEVAAALRSLGQLAGRHAHADPAVLATGISRLGALTSPLYLAKRVVLAGGVSSVTALTALLARTIGGRETVVADDTWASSLRGDGSETVAGPAAELLRGWPQVSGLAGVVILGEPPLPRPWERLAAMAGGCPVSYLGGPAELAGVAFAADLADAECTGRVLGRPAEQSLASIADSGGPVPPFVAGSLYLVLPGSDDPVRVCQARIRAGGVIEMLGPCGPAWAPGGPALCQLETTIAEAAGAADVHAWWRRGARLGVDLVPWPGTELSSAEVLERLRDRLPAHLLPEMANVVRHLAGEPDGWLRRAAATGGQTGPGDQAGLGARVLEALTE